MCFCVCTERLGTSVWSLHGEVWSRDVFVSFRDFVIECYNMYGTILKEFSHTVIISRYSPVAFMLDSVFPARRAPAAALLRFWSNSVTVGRVVMFWVLGPNTRRAYLHV